MEVKIVPIVTGWLEENCYLVYDPKSLETLVVDPGDDPEKIEAMISTYSLKPLAILQTHCHFDHFGAVNSLKRTYGIPVMIHPEEVPNLRLMERERSEYLKNDGPVEVDRNLKANEEFVFGKIRVKVLFTPGHTAGGVCFLVDSNHLLTGDTLFAGSIGRYDLPGGRFETLMKSIKTQLLTLPDETAVYPGHGEPTTIGYEKRYNPFLRGLVK